MSRNPRFNASNEDWAGRLSLRSAYSMIHRKRTDLPLDWRYLRWFVAKGQLAHFLVRDRLTYLPFQSFFYARWVGDGVFEPSRRLDWTWATANLGWRTNRGLEWRPYSSESLVSTSMINDHEKINKPDECGRFAEKMGWPWHQDVVGATYIVKFDS